jgi:hypothetical protein
MRRILGCSIGVFIVAALSSHGFALPRFAVRTGEKCQSCHVNPTGAEMRQTLGVQYGREQLPVPAWSKAFEIEDFSNLLTNFLGVGADFRTLFFYQQRDAQLPDSAKNNAFFQMQGDIYLNFKIAKKVSMFINKGLQNGYEIFGLLNILPASGHVKIGKFVPAFGTKIDDHTTYIRTYTKFSAELQPQLTGLEVGVSPGPATLIGGIYNAQDNYGATTLSQKAYLGRAEGIFTLADDIHFGIGADVFRKATPNNFSTTLWGGLASFSYKDFTIFGEADLIKNNGRSGVDGVVSYVEADFMITQGLDLKLAYDFYDPDKDVKSGSLSRYSFGFEFFPISGVEVRPLYRIVTRDPDSVQANEFDVIVHFYL